MKTCKIYFLFLFFVSIVSAYELPTVNLETSNPKIVMFDVTSTVLNNRVSYILKWKTINTTDVMLTFIGRVKTSGTLEITEDEYNRGPITITAMHKNTSITDSKTLNKFKKSDEAPVIFRKGEEDEALYRSPAYQNYRTMPYRGRLAPYGRRYY